MHNLHLTITQSQKDYTITIGNNLLEKIGELFPLQKYSKIFVVTDDHIAPLFLEKLLGVLPENTGSIILQSGEKEKNIVTVGQIWSAMKEHHLDRKSLVINLGGGVIGDMGGFAASTYMRGIDFLQIPTTLLSQIDASVGGKTGVDFAGIKNLIGTFNQPIGILIDTKTLETLPKRERISGFAEMIKHGLIADKTYFEAVTNKNVEDVSTEELTDLIARSCEIKKAIVEQDEKEKDMRKLVNFGHTIGHAIEALSLEEHNPLLHGEAIAIGMVAEAKIAQLQNMITEDDVNQIKNALEKTGLPVAKSGIDKKNLLTKMKSDKKNTDGKINFTLLSAIGKAEINQTVSDDVLAQAIDFINS